MSSEEAGTTDTEASAEGETVEDVSEPVEDASEPVQEVVEEPVVLEPV